MVAPDGRTWKVRRVWVEHSVRLRRERDLSDAPSGDGDGWSWDDFLGLDDITPAAILIALAVAVAGVLLFLVVWPLVALAVELVLLLVLFLAGVAGRLLLRRPWRVRAETTTRPVATLEWQVVGWRASGRLLDEVASSIQAGGEPPSPGRVAQPSLAAGS